MELADTLDALAKVTAKTAARAEAEAAKARRSESNRLNMLYVHAMAAILVGPAFIFYGQSSGFTGQLWTVVRAIPAAEHILGGALLLGGFSLMLAVAMRHLPGIAFGLSLILGWYLTITLSFAVATVGWYAGDRSGPAIAMYAPLVYGHMAAVMLVHLRTVARMVRNLPRRRRRAEGQAVPHGGVR